MYGSGSVYDKQVLSDLANGRTVVAEQDPRYGDFEDGVNTTSASPAVSIVDPIHPRARHAAAASFVPVSEVERGGN